MFMCCLCFFRKFSKKLFEKCPKNAPRRKPKTNLKSDMRLKIPDLYPEIKLTSVNKD